jgi:hypothetical protein
VEKFPKASSGCGWRNGLQLWKVAANILNKQLRIDNKGWPYGLGVGRGVNLSLYKNLLRKLLKTASDLDGFFV